MFYFVVICASLLSVCNKIPDKSENIVISLFLFFKTKSKKSFFFQKESNFTVHKTQRQNI